jgi:hypothetical protein
VEIGGGGLQVKTGTIKEVKLKLDTYVLKGIQATPGTHALQK